MVRNKQLQQVFRFIEGRQSRFVENLRRLCRQPSISAQNIGLDECVRLVQEFMEKLGVKTTLVPLKNGPPVVYGILESANRKAKTLLLYNHYDVQPPEPLNEWRSDPFSADIRDGMIFARGVADDKGPLMARLAAIEALQESHVEIPHHLKFVVEGEEEIGSPHLAEFVEKHKARLKADGCLWEGGELHPNGRPEIYLGVKGMQYVELKVRTAASDTHSMYAPVIPNAGTRLVQALRSLKKGDDQILVEGFYDDVLPPSTRDLELLRQMDFDEEAYKRIWGIRDFVGQRKNLELLKALYFHPTCTICGLSSGYQGRGSKTVNPAEARAKVDFRLVPNQRPADILRKIRVHLVKQGFSDVEVTDLNSLEPARSSLDSDVVKAVVDTAESAYDAKPVVAPMIPGSGPLSLFISTLRVPVVSGECVMRVDAGLHAPNEHIQIADYVKGIKHVAATILAF